jgi:hypothetical protein
MVVAFVALLVALGGTSYAALKLPRNSVGSAQIRKNAVTSSKVKARSLRLSDFSPSARTGLDGERGPQGPVGERGPQGEPGGGPGGTSTPALFYRSAAGTVAAKPNMDDPRITELTATCAAGEHALSGGLRVQLEGVMHIVDSFPAPGGTAWTTRVANDDTSAHSFTVYAVCTQSTVGQAP